MKEGILYLSACQSCQSTNFSLIGYVGCDCSSDSEQNFETIEYSSEPTTKVLYVHSCPICLRQSNTIDHYNDDEEDPDVLCSGCGVILNLIDSFHLMDTDEY